MSEAGKLGKNLEIVLLTKSHGPLTKQISLVNGQLVSDSSACGMAHGSASKSCSQAWPIWHP